MPNLTDTELAKLKEDEARLDWLVSKGCMGVVSYLPWIKKWAVSHGNSYESFEADNARQAIDAAMKAEEGGKDAEQD